MSDTKALNQTYNERNTLMIALARTMLLLGHKAGYGIDEAKANMGWDADWSTVVYIDLPDGSQLSYHMNNDTAAAARTLPLYPGKWDGTWLGREVPDWLVRMRDVGIDDNNFGDAEGPIVAMPMSISVQKAKDGSPMFSGASMTFPNLLPSYTITTDAGHSLFIPANMPAPSPNSILTSTPEMAPVTRDQMMDALQKLRDAVGDTNAKELVYRVGNAPRVAIIEANYFRAVVDACEAAIIEKQKTQVPK